MIYRGVTSMIGFGARTIAAPVLTGVLLDDFPNATAAYSLRKLRTAYAGSAIRLRRDSDNAEQDFGFSGSNFDAASAATFLTATNGKLVTWYDQSGNGVNVTQSTAGNQSLYVASGIGSLPCIRFNVSGIDNHSDIMPGSSTAWSCFVVATLSASSDGSGRMVSIVDSTTADYGAPNLIVILRNGTTAGLQQFYNGSSGGLMAVTYDVPNVLGAVYTGSVATMYKDGAAGTPVALALGTVGDGANDISLMHNLAHAGGGSADVCKGDVSEVVLWATNRTANVTDIDSNMGTYYGL